MLGDAGIEVIAQSEFGIDSAQETGTTFVENALIKARHAALKTGLPAIADDSGLVVKRWRARPASTQHDSPDPRQTTRTMYPSSSRHSPTHRTRSGARGFTV